MHSVELLLDPASEVAVVEEWRRLEAADLPNLSRHRGASNRPHVTVTTVAAWPGENGRAGALEPLAALPLARRLGSPVVFGAGPFVLARLVVVDEALLRLHAGLVASLGPPAWDHLLPGRWTPHVTLGTRLSGPELSAALAVVGGAPARDVVLDRARHWDAVARVEEPL